MGVHTAWPVVLAVIFGVICLVGNVMIIIKRNHTFIKCRNPFFLIIQNTGILAAATIIALFMGMRPEFSCYAYEIGSSLAYAGFATPFAIRSWEYCVNFHISKVRSRFSAKGFDTESSSASLTRSNVLLPNWGDDSWFFRNRWVGSPRFLLKVFICVDWVWFLPVIPFFMYNGQYDYDDKLSCKAAFSGGTVVTVVVVVIFLALAILMGLLMRGSRDAYRIKTEIVVCAFTWLAVIILWVVFSELPAKFQRSLSPNIWFLLGYYHTFGWSTIFPLYLAYKHDRMDMGEATAGFKEFIEKLENLHFRNAFHDFLALQFCQENILFYEVVMDWKRLPSNDSSRTTNAKFINENYILESGVCQVNISGPTREKINLAINKLEVLPDDLFDEALAAVLNVMHSNSYYQFKSHKLYQKAKV